MTFILQHWKGVVSLLLSFIAGIVATNLNNYDSDRRQSIREAYQQVIQAEKDLDSLFVKLNSIAAGDAPKTSADIEALASDLLAIKTGAYNIVLRAPSVGPQYALLEDRMVDLVKAAELLSSDPERNKHFESAIAEYALASHAFKKAVAKEQNHFSLL